MFSGARPGAAGSLAHRAQRRGQMPPQLRQVGNAGQCRQVGAEPEHQARSFVSVGISPKLDEGIHFGRPRGDQGRRQGDRLPRGHEGSAELVLAELDRGHSGERLGILRLDRESRLEGRHGRGVESWVGGLANALGQGQAQVALCVGIARVRREEGLEPGDLRDGPGNARNRRAGRRPAAGGRRGRCRPGGLAGQRPRRDGRVRRGCAGNDQRGDRAEHDDPEAGATNEGGHQR